MRVYEKGRRKIVRMETEKRKEKRKEIKDKDRKKSRTPKKEYNEGLK